MTTQFNIPVWLFNRSSESVVKKHTYSLSKNYERKKQFIPFFDNRWVSIKIKKSRNVNISKTMSYKCIDFILILDKVKRHV